MATTITATHLDPCTRSGPRRATSWLLLVPTVLGVGAALWSESLPAGAFLLAIGSMFALLFAGVLWLVLTVIWGLDRRAGRPSAASGRVLVIAAAVVATMVGLVATDAPLRARWSVSHDAFDRAADIAQAADEGAEPPVHHRLGAYRITDVDRIGDATIFTIPTSGIFTTSGFAHLPDGPDGLERDARFGSRFEPLGDDWYVWIRTD